MLINCLLSNEINKLINLNINKTMEKKSTKERITKGIIYNVIIINLFIKQMD